MRFLNYFYLPPPQKNPGYVITTSCLSARSEEENRNEQFCYLKSSFTGE